MFHVYCNMQSDVGGSNVESHKITHLTGGDFVNNSITINGGYEIFYGLNPLT